MADVRCVQYGVTLDVRIPRVEQFDRSAVGVEHVSLDTTHVRAEQMDTHAGFVGRGLDGVNIVIRRNQFVVIASFHGLGPNSLQFSVVFVRVSVVDTTIEVLAWVPP